MDKIELLLNRITEFPTLPTIYSSLLELTSNPRSTVQDVANLISKDQSASIKILKVVNSSIYSLQKRVDNISQAIFYLGFNEVKNITLALSVMEIFSKINSSEFNIIDLWKHSIAVGVISRTLGLKIGLQNPENFFTTGIVHDIGKLFFIKFFKEKYFKLVKTAQDTNARLVDLEKEEFGLHHDQVGSELAALWKLPSQIKNAIDYHNLGLVDGKPEYLVSCVHLANIIAMMLKLGNPGYNTVPQPNFQIWNLLTFPPGTLKDIYPELIESYISSEAILTIK